MSGIFDDIPEIINKIEPTLIERNWIFLAGTLFALAAISVFLILRKKSVKQLTPYELANIRLNFAKNIAESKNYAAALSLLVRDYIGAVFKIPAPERTTEEFLRIAKESAKLSEDARKKIETLLTLSDMAKFARLDFDAHRREEMFGLARSFIEDDNAKRLEVAAK